jgi:hypothetical protein
MPASEGKIWLKNAQKGSIFGKKQGKKWQNPGGMFTGKLT